jgi:hypothetical protein
MSRIFISYRREDSADSTGRIYDRLASHFGAEYLVRDVDSIPLGVNFYDYLTKSVSQCQVLIVVIGKNWLDSIKRRVNDPQD